MKRYLVFLSIVFIGIIEPMTAQEADEKIGNLINQTDWFALQNEYFTLQDEVQSEMLRHFAEAMIGFHFNQPQKAIDAIDWLLENAQGEIGFSNTSNLILIKNMIKGKQGRYAESVDNLSNFLTQVTQFAGTNDFSVHYNTLTLLEKLHNEDKAEIIRPDKDVEIPLIIENVGRGQLMYVPVSVKGREYNFIFDTGAEETFLSERFANEMGVRIIDDSVTIRGAITSSVGKRGIIDSIIIGDIVFKNSVVAISLPNEKVDTIFQIDAVLGLDFMNMIGEVQIFPQDKKIIFPIQNTELPSFGSNFMLLNATSPYLKMNSNEEKLVFLFDTGNTKTDLNQSYYEKNKEAINKLGSKKTVRRGGFGGVGFFDAYQMPILPLTIGDSDFELTDVEVVLDGVTPNYNENNGNLGMDFITSFRKIIINFNDMFVKVEK